MPSNTQDTFCPLPWMQLYLSEDGRQYPCCSSQDMGDAGKGIAGALERGEKQPLETLWNSAYMRGIRRNMRDGQIPKPCTKCFEFEAVGLDNYRRETLSRFPGVRESLLSQTQEDGFFAPHFQMADLRFGNTCNLRCRMCRPESSSGLKKEFEAIYAFDPNSLHGQQWHLSPAVMEELNRHLKDLSYLHLAGGEPFVTSSVLGFLRELIDKGIAPQIQLAFTSNLGHLPEEMVELWSHFKSVDLQVSLDGVEGVQEYVRFPLRFKEFKKNLEFLDSHFESLNISCVRFNTTVQLYTIHGLRQTLDFAAGFRNFSPFPRLSVLRSPAAFSLGVLPIRARLKLAEDLREFIAQRESYWHSLESRAVPFLSLPIFLRSLEAVQSILREEPENAELQKEFLRVTDFFDHSRSQRLSAALPDLAEAFGRA